MRVDWCVSSWFRIKNTHSLTLPCVCVCARGGSFVDGCGIAAQSVPWQCLRLFAAGGLLLAAMAKNSSRWAAHQGLMLWRDVRRMRQGGRAHA